MTRVDGNGGPSESERLQSEADKRAREDKVQKQDREAFGRMLKTQHGARETTTQKQKAAGETRQGETHAKTAQKGQSEAQAALARARGGLMQQARSMEQSHGFQGALSQAGQKTQQSDAGRVERRDHGKQKDRVEHEDRSSELVKKSEAKRDADVEQARVEAHEAHRPNAAIGNDAGDDKGNDPGKRGDGAVGALPKPTTTQAAQGAKAAAPVKQIPPELLEKLVSTVHLAVNDKGLREFQIEMKDGPLKGALLKISADNGKVSLKFSGLDAQTKNLVEASKGELMRRLDKKGLSLGRLDVG